ncbi:PHD-zinc-finger like domain-containing protein [Phycomyces blakesleeanus]|uniref:PHD-zinc-finger like domain-containing protein n=1 Tax=Phycomyces blakesleeanus TaxID=4837 RepID=A0ABR3AIB8_PHYBL
METCNEDNPFVYCDEPECDVIIHQKCYGIDKCPGSEDTWRCDRCESLKVNRSKMVICALCPTSHGAFRKLEGPFFGLGWVHVACALWIPGVYIADPDQIKGINLRSVKPSCWKGKCAVCPDPVQAEYGACVSCQEPGCDTMFHVSCGQKYGLVRITVSGKRSICCYNHDKRERFKRARPEQRMNLWDRWVETRDEYLESADGETGAKKEFLSAWHKAYKDISHDNIESSSEAFSKFCDNINTICNTRYKEAKAIITEGKARLAKLYENIQRHSSSRDQTALQIELKAVMTRIQRASESNRRNKRYYDDILEQATRLSFQLVLKNNDKSKPVSVQPLVQNPVNSPSSVQLNFVAEVFSPDLSANKAQKAVPRNPKKKDSSRLNKALVASTLVGSDSIFNWVDASPDLESKKKSGTQTKPPKPTVTGNKKLTGKKALNVITADPQVKRRSKTKSTKGPKPPKTPKQAISKQTVNANQKKKAEKPSKAAERSFKTPEELDNCICGECNQHDLPQEALDRLKLPEDYMKRLEETVHLRLNGYTGKGLNWDPRVFIECSACKGEFHCGCPNPPIKNYPAPHEIFVCVHCDTTAEDLEESEAQRDLRDSANRTRVKARINYKE